MPDVHPLSLRVEQEQLENGLTLVGIEMPHLHTVEVSMFLRAGPRFETKENNGVSHFLEHILFRGNAKYPDSVSLNKEFEKIGRELRASTLSEYTWFGFSPHRDYLERGLELFSDFFLEPNFSGLEIEREIILEECLEDLNAKGEDIDINNLACQLMYPEDALAMPTIGTEKSIRHLSLEEIKGYFSSFYVPKNMVLAVAGAMEMDPFLEQSRRLFCRRAKSQSSVSKIPFAVKDDQQKARWFFQYDSDSQIQLQICFRGVSYNHPDYHAVYLLSRLFDDGVSSRLQKKIREDQGLAYAIECRSTHLSDTGTFDFDIAVRPEKTTRAANIIFNEIKKFLLEGPSEDELDHVKNRASMDLDLEKDDPYKQIMRFAWPQLYSEVLSLEEEKKINSAISVSDIRRVSKAVFRSDCLNVVMLGPFDSCIEKELIGVIEGF